MIMNSHTSKSEFDKSGAMITFRATTTKKSKKQRIKNSLPNFHIVLHYKETVTEYPTVANCNAFAEEMEHK